MSTTPNLITIDYVRLATFDFQAYCKISAAMRQKFVGWRKSRWLQYTMERSQENVSYGIAEQKKRPHGIFEASGVDAHIFATWFLATQKQYRLSIYASRIDLQLTKQKPESFDYIKAHKRLAKPKQLILGDDGNTLYIGNRQSDSFWRLYDKSAGLVRCEVELKGKQAKRAWSTIANGQDLAEVYVYYLAKSRLPKMLVDYYQDGKSPLADDDLAEVVPVDLETRFAWLASLDGLVYKLANDHDLAERMTQLISRWDEYTTKH